MVEIVKELKSLDPLLFLLILVTFQPKVMVLEFNEKMALFAFIIPVNFLDFLHKNNGLRLIKDSSLLLLIIHEESTFTPKLEVTVN